MFYVSRQKSIYFSALSFSNWFRESNKNIWTRKHLERMQVYFFQLLLPATINITKIKTIFALDFPVKLFCIIIELAMKLIEIMMSLHQYEIIHGFYVLSLAVTQSIYSRSPSFDGALNLLSPYDIVGMEGAPRLWINVEVSLLLSSFWLTDSCISKLHYPKKLKHANSKTQVLEGLLS